MNKKIGLLGVFLFVLTAMGFLLAQTGAPPASGQAQPQQAVAKPLQYEVSVVLKLIHVYVTDKKGRPVKDLAVGDFTVTDEGNPVTITDFETHALEAAAGPEAADAAPAAAPPTAVRPVSRKFFLFFDFAFNNSHGVVKARTAALHFLDTQVGPEDEVGILSYSMLKGLAVHEYLTRDRAEVREVVAAIGSKDVAGRANQMGDWYWRLVEDPLMMEPTYFDDPNMPVEPKDSGKSDPYRIPYYASDAKSQRDESKKIAEYYIARLTDLAKSMRFVEGQKHFILFSSGLPTSLVYGTQAGNPPQPAPVGAWSAGQVDLGDSVLKSRNENMLKEFAAAGCRFFAFDTRESAKGIDLFGYDSRTMEIGSRSSVFGKDGVFADSANVVKDEKGTGLDYLKLLTETTGGKYYSNINMYGKNLDQVQATTGTYYVLGFPVNEQRDGKFHDVKVAVTRKGCEIRAQAGYFDPKPYSQYTDLEKQLHLFDLALNERAFSRLAVKVPMAALTTGAEGLSRLGLLARVPGEVMAKFTGQRLEFVAIIFDEKGEVRSVVREETNPESLRGRDLTFAAGATLRPGDYSCRLVIRDMDTGQSAVASAKATVVKPQITGLQLGTPLVLEPGTGCSFLSPSAKRAREAFPWAEIYPYDSGNLSPVVGERGASGASVQVVVPCAVPGGGRPEMGLSANVVNAASGERTPVTILRKDRTQKGPLLILNLEIQTAGIAPGTYFLHIYVQDRVSNSLGHSFTTLSIGR
jgi:VWFA-related protein